MTTPAPPASPWRLAILIASLVMTIAAVYGGVLRCGFVYDDEIYVSREPHVAAGLTADTIAWAFETIDGGIWDPLVRLSHLADVTLFGLDAGAHHRTNLLIHAANAALLLLVLFRMTRRLWPSAMAAALFALHPLHVEDVAWISARKDLLSTLFWLLAIQAWVRYTERPGVRRYLVVAACFALGLMSKPMLVTFPFTLLLLDVWPLGRLGSGEGGGGGIGEKPGSTPWRLVVEKAPFFLMSAASMAIAFVGQKKGGALELTETLPAASRISNALVSYVSYLGQTLWPSRLAVFYPHPGLSLPLSKGVAAGLLLATITALTLLWPPLRRMKYPAVGLLWFLGTLVPVIGFVQFGGHARADRFTYVPLIGIFVAAVWGAADLASRRAIPRSALAALSAAILIPLAITSHAQVRHWESNATLFSHALEVTRDNHVAHQYVAVAFAREGRYDDAIAHFREAVRIRPGFSTIWMNLAGALLSAGRTGEAIEAYRQSISLRPENADSHFHLAMVYEQQGDHDQAISLLRETARLDPKFAMARYSIGVIFAGQGKTGEAIEEFAAAVRIDPDSIEAQNNLGALLADRGRFAEAVPHYREALRISPTEPLTHRNLGRALESLGKNDEAIAEYQAALRLRPDYADAQTDLRRIMSSAR